MSFDEWFEGVYGKEPYPQKSIETLREEIHEANRRLLYAEGRLREREEWEARRDGARAAWRELEAIQRLGDDPDNIHLTMAVLCDIFAGDTSFCASACWPLGLAKAVAAEVEKLRRKVDELEGQSRDLARECADLVNCSLAGPAR